MGRVRVAGGANTAEQAPGKNRSPGERRQRQSNGERSTQRIGRRAERSQRGTSASERRAGRGAAQGVRGGVERRRKRRQRRRREEERRDGKNGSRITMTRMQQMERRRHEALGCNGERTAEDTGAGEARRGPHGETTHGGGARQRLGEGGRLTDATRGTRPPARDTRGKGREGKGRGRGWQKWQNIVAEINLQGQRGAERRTMWRGGEEPRGQGRGAAVTRAGRAARMHAKMHARRTNGFRGTDCVKAAKRSKNDR